MSGFAASNISGKKKKLEKERREFMKNAMREFDIKQAKQIKQLRKECERETGHNFLFSHLGPLNNPWFYCSWCNKSKVEEE